MSFYFFLFEHTVLANYYKKNELRVFKWKFPKVGIENKLKFGGRTERLPYFLGNSFLNTLKTIKFITLLLNLKKDLAMNKSKDMVNFLKGTSNQTTFDSLKQGFNGIFHTIANSLIVK